ncbi:unnamed protein product [Closterium sp. NIES-53]
MASLWVLAFDHEGRPVQFDTWLDDLQLYLPSDFKDNVSLFDIASGATTAPPATADSSIRSQWFTRDAAARLTIRNHLPLADWWWWEWRSVCRFWGWPASAAAASERDPCLPSSFTCGRLHTQHRCFSRLDDAWRAEFGDDVELPHWADLLKSRIAIFDLEFDAIFSAMYALSVSAEGDCYRCVPPDPGIVAAALGASESGTLPGTAPAKALHTFTLDSGASRCNHVDQVLLYVPVDLPSRRPPPFDQLRVDQHSRQLTTQVGCQKSASPSRRRLPGRPLEVGADFQVDVPHHRPPVESAALQWPRASRPTLSTSSPKSASPTAASWLYLPYTQPQSRLRPSEDGGQHTTPVDTPVSGGSVRLTLRSSPPLVLYELGEYRCPSGCNGHYHHSWGSACVDLHVHTDEASPGYTLLWHHRLGHPSLPRLHGMHSRLLVYGLPTYLPPLPPSPALPCLPCVEGRQRAAPHSSSFLPTTAPLQTLHMDVWGPARISGQSRERYFLLVVDDYTRYTTVFPLRIKGQDLPVLRLHSDRGGEFSSNLLREFCCGEGIVQSFTLPDSPQQNGIAEHRIGLDMEFYHLTSRRVLPSQDVTFDESVPFYRLFPYSSTPPLPLPLFLAPDPLPGPAADQVIVGSGAARGAASGGAASGGVEPGGAESEGAEPGGAEPEGVEPGGAASEGAESGGAEPQGAASSGATGAEGAGGARAAGASGAGGAAATGPGGARTRGTAAAGTGGVEGAGVVGRGAGGAGAAEAGVGGTGSGGIGAVDPCAGGTGGTVRPQPYFSQPPLQPASPKPAPSPYTEQTGGLTEHREPASRHASLVRTARRSPRSRPPPVPGTHAMTLRPSSVPLRVPLPAPESSLPEVLDPESDRARAVSPGVSPLLATAVTYPSFESAATFALVAELLDFAAACRLDYATALVAESSSASPPSVRGECALGTDVLEDRQEDIECLAAAVPRFSSMLLAPKGDPDAPDIPTPRSYAKAIMGTYVDEVPPPGANIVDGMWIFRVKRPPGSPPAFKARYVARGFSQRQGVDNFQTFSPTPKMTTLWVLLHVAAQPLEFAPSTADPLLFLRTDTSLPPFYVLVYIDDLVFATADTEALTLVKSELQKRHTCTDLGELRSYLGMQITRDRARRTITLTQSHMVHQVLQRFGFQFSSPQPTPLSTSHSLSAPPSDESVEPSGPYPELMGCLMYLMICTRPDLVYPLSLLARHMALGRHRKVHWDAAKRVLRYLCNTLGMGLVLGGRGPVVLTGHADASWFDDSATQRSSQGYTFSLESGSVSWRSTRSSLVLSSSCEAENYAGAMAAQELRWLTYLLTDLGEQPPSPPQRGQLRLAYVATRAKTADIFTKALPPGGARIGGTGAAGARGAAGVGAGDTGAGGAGPGDAGAVGAGSKDTGRPQAYFFPYVSRFLVSRLLLLLLLPYCVHRLTNRSRCYSQPPHCLLLLLTLSRPEVLQSVVSLYLVLPCLLAPFALVVVFRVRVLFLSLAPTIWHFSAAASTLVTELVEFAAVCRLDYATSFIAESGSACPLSVGGECALGTDVLEHRQEDFECLAAAVVSLVAMLLAPEGDPDAPDIPTPRSYAEAITGPYSSQWQTAMDAEMASWKSTGTYVDAVPLSGANIVDGMWIFRGVDFFHTFSPTPKMTTLQVLLRIAAQRDYELHCLDFSTTFLLGSLHEEIWLRRPPGFTGSFPAGTQWSLRRPVYGSRQAPREWHDTLRTTLAALGFAPLTADPSLFLRTDTSLSSFYVLVYLYDLVFATVDTEALALVKLELQKRHTCIDLGPPLDESVEPSGPYPELVGCLMYLMTCTRPDLAYSFSILAHYVARKRHRPEQWEAARGRCATCAGYTFSLGSGSVSWRSTRSSSVLSSSCEAEIYTGAMAAQELHWLTYLLTDLGERPCSSPVLYVDNKAMIALCQEHRLEHKTKHIALRYFLARELQQRGQLCLAYVATRANTVDIFTKALESCDHQRIRTVLGLVPTLPHLLTA